MLNFLICTNFTIVDLESNGDYENRIHFYFSKMLYV